MQPRPPENPTEDRFIGLLDRNVRLDEREVEMQAIRRQMAIREGVRLKFLLRAAKMAEAAK